MQKEEGTSRTTMIDKETRKKRKQIKKEIRQLKKLKFRPCHNDSEQKQKDKDIKTFIFLLTSRRGENIFQNSSRPYATLLALVPGNMFLE